MLMSPPADTIWDTMMKKSSASVVKVFVMMMTISFPKSGKAGEVTTVGCQILVRISLVASVK